MTAASCAHTRRSCLLFIVVAALPQCSLSALNGRLRAGTKMEPTPEMLEELSAEQDLLQQRVDDAYMQINATDLRVQRDLEAANKSAEGMADLNARVLDAKGAALSNKEESQLAQKNLDSAVEMAKAAAKSFDEMEESMVGMKENIVSIEKVNSVKIRAEDNMRALDVVKPRLEALERRIKTTDRKLVHGDFKKTYTRASSAQLTDVLEDLGRKMALEIKSDPEDPEDSDDGDDSFVQSIVQHLKHAQVQTSRFKKAKLDINQKVYIENAAVLGDGAGDGALNVCRMFTNAHVENPAAPVVKVCGTGIKATVYMRGRCEEYYTHQQVIGKCDSGAPASTCDVFSPAHAATFGAYQSYKVEQC